MLPEEIGHAAAYEAYRIWMHDNSLYEHFIDDFERQREGLVGLAIAEGKQAPLLYAVTEPEMFFVATRLLRYSGRGMDPFYREAATEAAAATVSMIFYEVTSLKLLTCIREKSH